jgi:hypothetical protein
MSRNFECNCKNSSIKKFGAVVFRRMQAGRETVRSNDSLARSYKFSHLGALLIRRVHIFASISDS